MCFPEFAEGVETHRQRGQNEKRDVLARVNEIGGAKRKLCNVRRRKREVQSSTQSTICPFEMHTHAVVYCQFHSCDLHSVRCCSLHKVDIVWHLVMVTRL